MIVMFVTYQDKTYRVSTINRESSSMEVCAKYAETLVWEWDKKQDTRIGDILMQGTASEGSIRTHQRIVELIHNEGIKEQDND